MTVRAFVFCRNLDAMLEVETGNYLHLSRQLVGFSEETSEYRGGFIPFRGKWIIPFGIGKGYVRLFSHVNVNYGKITCPRELRSNLVALTKIVPKLSIVGGVYDCKIIDCSFTYVESKGCPSGVHPVVTWDRLSREFVDMKNMGEEPGWVEQLSMF